MKNLMTTIIIASLLSAGSAFAWDVPDGFVLVTEWGFFDGTTVAKIDPATDKIVTKVTVGDSPNFITYDSVRRIAYVSLHDDNKIAALKVDTLEVADLSIANLGKAPIRITLTPDGLRLLAATRGTDGVISEDDRLDIISLNHTTWPPAASIITSIFTGLHPIRPLVNNAGTYAVVTVRNEPAILIIDLATYQVVYEAPNLPPNANSEE